MVCPIIAFQRLSRLWTRPGLANERISHDLAEDVRSSIGLGLFSSIESRLFSQELEISTVRRPPNIEKMMESLLETTTLRIENVDFFFYRPVIRSCIEKASISSKQRKRLSSQLEKLWGSPGEAEFLTSYLSLRKCGVSLESLLGFPIGRTLVCHFSTDVCRFRHVLGLADAVHFSLFNLNIKVSFPQRILRSVPSALGAERRSSVKVKGVDPKDIMLHPVRQERYFSMGRAICCSQRPKTPSGLGLGMEDPLRNGKVVLHRLTTKDRRFRLILHFLRVFPHGLPEKKYVKIIKNTLADEFSFQMEQERPDIPDGRIALFPSPTQKRLDKRFRGDRKNRCRFYKNLLESKSLCAPVGADMILETYVEHKQSLCRDQGVSPR